MMNKKNKNEEEKKKEKMSSHKFTKSLDSVSIIVLVWVLKKVPVMAWL